MSIASWRWPVVAALCCVALVGCRSPEPPRPAVGVEKIESAALRTDREPIEKRYPQLGAFTDVHWLGGTLGDDRVPGPSLYFIEAAVQLRPDDAAALRQRYAFVATADPSPPGPLTGHLGGSGWTASPELDRAVSPTGWTVHVHLRPDRPVAYVSARGE